MSWYQININDNAITEQINSILNTIFKQELNSKYSGTGDIIASAVKDLIYSHKDEIIDKVVDRATKEIVRKGLPKLLERVIDNDT
ncbi:MAG: hypothetical protein ACI4IM_00470 [Acutalibacteraceae bacterium]